MAGGVGRSEGTAEDPALRSAVPSGTGPAAPGTAGPSRADPKVLELLVCPITKARLEYDAERQELISRTAGLAYPIRDGVMVLLEGEARRL